MMKPTLFLALSLFTVSANASLVNGDFEAGNLGGWTTFTNNANGTIGAPGVASFDVTGSGSSLAANFNVGNVVNPGNNGGGIFQSFNSAGGSTNVSVDIAVQTGSLGNNDAGEFTLLINGVVADFHDFGNIASNAVERSSLSAIVNLLPGANEFRVLMTRSFQTSTNTPTQWVDNALVGNPSAIPVPAAAWLFGTALLGLIGYGKRKSRAEA